MIFLIFFLAALAHVHVHASSSSSSYNYLCKFWEPANRISRDNIGNYLPPRSSTSTSSSSTAVTAIRPSLPPPIQARQPTLKKRKIDDAKQSKARPPLPSKRQRKIKEQPKQPKQLEQPEEFILPPIFPTPSDNASGEFLKYHALKIVPNRYHKGFECFQSYRMSWSSDHHPLVFAISDLNLPAIKFILSQLSQESVKSLLSTGSTGSIFGSEENSSNNSSSSVNTSDTVTKTSDTITLPVNGPLLMCLFGGGEALRDLEEVLTYFLDLKVPLFTYYRREIWINFYDRGIFGYRYCHKEKRLPAHIKGSPALAYLLYRVLVGTIELPYCLEKFITLVVEQNISIDHPEPSSLLSEEDSLSPSVMALLNGIMEAYPGKISKSLFEKFKRYSLKPFELVERTHSPLKNAKNSLSNFEALRSIYDEEGVSHCSKQYFNLCLGCSIYPGCSISQSLSYLKCRLGLLYLAIADGNLPIIREYFKHRGSIFTSLTEDEVQIFPIEWMIKRNPALKTRTIIQVIGLLHANGYPVDRRDDRGDTLLHWAVVNKPEIMGCLVSLGYGLDVPNAKLQTPRDLASFNAKAAEILKMIRSF